MVKTIPFDLALRTLSLPGLDRNLFSSPDWLLMLKKTYHLNVGIKYIERQGKVSSYIIYTVVKNFLEWKICICSYCDYCDGYVETLDDWKLFLESLKEQYPKFRIAIRNLRDELIRSCPDINELGRERFHLLDVRDDLNRIWKRAHDSFKAAVHQSERSGVVVKKCPRGELEKFYDLHLQIRKNKYHIFPQPFNFFRNIWKQFMDHDRGALLGAYDKDGKFIGGNIYLICGKSLYYKFNTSSLGALKLRPNNLLFWEGIKYAKERGLDEIDLGSSGCHQTGLIRFKEHVGATGHDIIHLGYHPPGYKFSEKRILKIITRMFTVPWMPNQVVKIGSHGMYHFLA